MPAATLELTLQSPVALTARSSTVGGHRTLTWIPGAQLMGATAATLGLQPGSPLPEPAWRILGSGEVRFGDAWPTDDDGNPAFIAPLALHHAKGEKVDQGAPLTNLAVARRPAGKQLVQLRRRHVSASQRLVTPATTYGMRTAVNAQGRAREGFLFGIESLDPGQRLRTRIEADSEELLEQVVGLLVGASPIRVGRSRNAEFGAVDVRRVDDAPVRHTEVPQPGRLVIWMVSDLALRERTTGAPRLTLEPSDLGLPPDWSRDPSRTFVRTRRYSPFNGARRRPDLERQVIEAGSVVVFTGTAPIDRAALSERVARGLGDYLQEGLGRAFLDPELLSGAELTFRAVAEPLHSASEIPDPPKDGFLGPWLTERIKRERESITNEATARTIASEFRRARIRNSQWGEIRRLARQARPLSDRPSWLHDTLQSFLEHGARVHIWKHHKDALLRHVQVHKPVVIEMAANRLMRPSGEGDR